MIRRLRRAYCSVFGHAWSRWSDWVNNGALGFVHTRECARCRATEIKYDGEDGYVRG